MNAVTGSPVFGTGLTVGVYAGALWLHRRCGRHPLLTPVMVTIVVVALALHVLDIDYATYAASAAADQHAARPGDGGARAAAGPGRPQPARPIGCRCWCRSAAAAWSAIGSVWVLAAVLGADDALVLALLPKSTTTPVAIGLAETIGAAAPLAAVFAIAVRGGRRGGRAVAARTWSGSATRGPAGWPSGCRRTASGPPGRCRRAPPPAAGPAPEWCSTRWPPPRCCRCWCSWCGAEPVARRPEVAVLGDVADPETTAPVRRNDRHTQGAARSPTLPALAAGGSPHAAGGGDPPGGRGSWTEHRIVGPGRHPRLLRSTSRPGCAARRPPCRW